ncbi:MFS general substrate transporter [Purpureocillium lavendulum]|uniref:MFS general substrate transporter n=1 Tax=Purpureocillium lavendulum TaxID=1247861 RepID=A0AB34FI83_9HYPO|nr:MFS general substrate transporter [Purpureocillium lavendulum]
MADTDTLSSPEKSETVLVKTTKDGIPLVPQPSDDPEDPLNWSTFKKHAALVVLAMESLMVKFSATLIAPGALTLAEEFHTNPSKATYIGSAPSVLYAVAPLLWIPLSQRIGRRPVLILGQLVALAGAIGVARAQSYAGALGCRMVMGFGGSMGLCIGPASISDMFFLHEKGTRIGINSFLLVTAPWIGGVAGGSIQNNKALGWRWSMYISAICYAVQFIAQLIFVPETIYEREVAAAEPPEAKRTIWRRLGFRTPTNPGRRTETGELNPKGETWAETFRRPYALFVYPAVVLPCFWVSVAVMTEVANTAGFALNFGGKSRFKFNSAQIGFCFFSGLIGAFLGELLAGPLCDVVAKRALSSGREWRPESLLKLSITGLVSIMTGLIVYGTELDLSKHWAPPLVGMVLFILGQEIIVTVVLTYMMECYPGMAAEVAIVFQFFFNLMCFHPPFYTPQWIERAHGAKVPYIIYAILPVIFFPPCIGLFMWKGPAIRKRGAVFAFMRR